MKPEMKLLKSLVNEYSTPHGIRGEIYEVISTLFSSRSSAKATLLDLAEEEFPRVDEVKVAIQAAKHLEPDEWNLEYAYDAFGVASFEGNESPQQIRRRIHSFLSVFKENTSWHN